MIVVLVHGIHDTSAKFKTMKAAFEKAGFPCIVPSLTPKNGSKGLEYLARQLKDIIDADPDISNKSKICLVGFSMGALISRYYLQELDGFKIVRQFFSISGPHHGSLWAYLSFSLGARQMRPNSDFIQMLNQSSNRLYELEIYSYWTPFDLMILPATSSIWDMAENISVNILCHPFMVSSNKVISDIVDKIRMARQ
ncbi:MAG: esterase/lipase family protein [Methylococcaceae bacterium]